MNWIGLDCWRVGGRFTSKPPSYIYKLRNCKRINEDIGKWEEREFQNQSMWFRCEISTVRVLPSLREARGVCVDWRWESCFPSWAIRSCRFMRWACRWEPFATSTRLVLCSACRCCLLSRNCFHSWLIEYRWPSKNNLVIDSVPFLLCPANNYSCLFLLIALSLKMRESHSIGPIEMISNFSSGNPSTPEREQVYSLVNFCLVLCECRIGNYLFFSFFKNNPAYALT